MQKDLTKGNVLKNIITFSLPFLLSNFLQTFYGMTDLFIVGCMLTPITFMGVKTIWKTKTNIVNVIPNTSKKQ